jgi:TonB-dependent receptor
MITKTTTPTRSGAWYNRWMGICTLALLTALSPALRAQDGSTGTVTGTVLDSSSGRYLEGAEVSIASQGVSLRTNSERGGEFTLTGVPAGPQSLAVSYPGLESKSETVNVVAGQTVSVPVNLSGETVMLEALTVSTAKEGMAQAQALQKASIQFKLVAANDQFGPVSEGNVGEYLKFLPGVGIDYTANDARGVSLRGLNTSFTVVTVDGTPMASAASGDDSRRFEFEQIAMNNVETTELFKTVTPDIPANATGGFVNFVTKSAFDRRDISVLSYDVSFIVPDSNFSLSKENGTWGKGEHFVIRPAVELNYARRVSEKIGFNLNYRLSEKYDDAPRTEYTWLLTGNSGTSFANPKLQQFQIRDEQKLTHRQALASKVDYLISDRTKLMVVGQWNWYDLTFTQRGPVFNLGTNQAVTGGGANTALSGGTVARVNNSILQRNKYGTTLHLNTTLQHEFSNASKAWISGYWSNANSKYRDTTKGYVAEAVASLTGNPTIGVDNVLTQRIPNITLGGGTVSLDAIRNIDNYTYNTNGSNLRSRPFTAEDEKKGFNAHYSYDLDSLFVPLKLQVGTAYDLTERYTNRIALQGTNTSTVSGLGAYADPGYTDDIGYGFGSFQTFDVYKLYDAFGSRLLTVQENFVRNFDEKNLAGYFRADAKLTQDLLLVGGIRWEKREIEARSQNLHVANSRPGSAALEYDSVYPSAAIKYTPSAHKPLVVRAGVSRTVGHPDYSELLVTATAPGVSGTDGTITIPDPDLNPYFVKNYDVSVDYYLGNSGVVGVTAFRKELKNFITNRAATTDERNEIFQAYGLTPTEYSNGSVTLATNGAGSEVDGIELSYAQRFAFLPSPFNGLNLQANFTTLDYDGDDLATETAQGRNAITKSANFILGYRIRGFSFTSSTNWTDDVQWDPVQGTGTAQNLRYKGDYTTTNWKFEYSIDRRYSVYFNINNVFSAARDDYIRGYAPENRRVALPYRYAQFGEPYYTVGVRGTF